MIDFYYGYIYALIEVYAYTDDPTTREGILSLLRKVLEDFEVEARQAAWEEEAPEVRSLGERMDG